MSTKPNPSNTRSALKDSTPSIQSLRQLKHWLVSKGIDTSYWGQGSTKTLESLWNEIVGAETGLQDDPPLRIIDVVQVIIRHGDEMLIEAEQEFADKRRRRRSHPPSEKMKRGECHLEAAARCLQEELGLELEDFEILPDTYHQRQDELESPSYPGLHTCYVFHVVEAKVKGLPTTDFWTNESAQNPNDPIKRHYWTWQTAADKVG